MRRPQRELPKKTASLEPLNGVDLRESMPSITNMVIEGDEILMRHIPLLRLVMNKASDKYVGMIVQLSPLPNRTDQSVYTLAVKGSKLLGTDGPGALEWRTIAEGTLPELLKVVSKEE